MFATYMIFVMIFKTLQQGDFANDGASPTGNQICTLYYFLYHSPEVQNIVMSKL